MGETSLAAILVSVGALLTAGAAAWVSLKKSRSEIDKGNRDGVIKEWQDITDRLQKRIDEQDTKISAQDKEIITLRTELAALRTQISARETERVEQRTDIRHLEKAVVELKQTEATAKDKP